MPIEDDLRASLRRAAGSAEPPGSAWDQLVDRAERPTPTPGTTRSRIGAGLVAAVVTIAAFALVFRAFGPPDPAGLDEPVSLPADALDHTRWLLDELDGVSMAEGPELDLAFEGGEYSARSECNDSGGRYGIEGATLTTSGGSQTDVGCQGAAEERQAAIFGVVRSSPRIELTGATLTLTSEAGVLRYVTHPCSLLTDDEVERATGDRVTSSGLVPLELMRVPGGPRSCSYEVPGTYTSVGVHVQPSTLEEFHATPDRDPESNITIPVEGIGDEAYIEGMGSISVFRGDHYVSIGLQHGAGTPDVTRVLEDLARAALGMDPAIDPINEPVPDDALVIWVEAPEPDDQVFQAPALRATFGDRETSLEAIETPGSEIAYPSRDLGVAVPVGTPVIVRTDVDRVVIRQLVDAGPGELVERSARRLPGELTVLDEPGEVAIAVSYEYLEGVGELGFTVQVAPDEPPDEGRVIGPGLRLCDVQRLDGLDLFGDGSLHVAWTGAPIKDNGRCPTAYDTPHVVALDLDADGSADSWTDLPVCTGCKPYAVTDLGGDGSNELIVLLQWNSTPQYGIYDVVPNGLPRAGGIYPIFVEAPGAPDAGLPAGEPFTLWAGGDEGFAAAIRCEGYPDDPRLVLTWTLSRSPEATTKVIHLTTLRLDEPDASGASVVVVSTSSREVPVAEPLPFSTPTETCGVIWEL